MSENKPKIATINEILKMNLSIPSYQRPYKWEIRNINDLLNDIESAEKKYKKYGKNFRYRVGTIILHGNDIVDGQQRIISFVLLKKFLDPSFNCSILEIPFTNKTTQANIHKNYMFIKEWFSMKGDESKETFRTALEKVLEAVVLSVNELPEAFQLFDSQNTRGKSLDPHDLLKAYHLREMKMYPYEMEYAVTKWEAKKTDDIRELFAYYLFPIWNWSHGSKSKSFTEKEIDTYKGVLESSAYTYAKRAIKAMPYFQITEPFTAGNDFFEMTDHYLILLEDIKKELAINSAFKSLYDVLQWKTGSSGFDYAKNLFYCAMLYYYDKFHNFDVMAVTKLFIWAFMLRIDMKNLGFDSINKYAIGDDTNSSYTNAIPMFRKINFARLHSEISSLQVKVKRDLDAPANANWVDLYQILKELSGISEVTYE